jgi:uncharacterized protein (DUF2141 family)
MAGKHFIVLVLSALVSSCAQVGTLTGGDSDTTAPRPVLDKVSPPNASVNFQGKQVIIPFEEYFSLSNPVQNIRMVPPHASVTASVKKKTLTLQWEEDLEPNTTYAIYLNGAVKDITEGNDSTMQYVFSTGNIIDTLSYTVPVVDAWTGQPITGSVVGLFEPSTHKLVSFAKSNNGLAELKYLKPGTYELISFDDDNGDLEYQPGERVGFPDEGRITIEETTFDSIPIRMYAPIREPKIRTSKVIAPCSFLIGTNQPLNRTETTISVHYPDSVLLDAAVHPFSVDWIADDSLLFYPGELSRTSGKIILNSPELTDTVSFRYRKNDFEEEVKIKAGNASGVKPSENLEFAINSFIYNVDTSIIALINLTDSSTIEHFTLKKSLFSFEIEIEKENVESVQVVIPKGTFITTCKPNESFSQEFTINSERKYGELNVHLEEYTTPIILQLLKGKKVVQEQFSSEEGSTILFHELEPGEYHFRVIQDLNSNKRWDVGEYLNYTLPEPVDTYSKKTKVRANWTIDVTLSPTK